MVIRTHIDYFQTHFVAQLMAQSWQPPAIRIEGKSKRLRDFVSWMNQVPVISEKARITLEPLLGKNCEILPLTELRGKPYYGVNVLTVLDCLDHACSDILYAPDDPMKILRISRYVFDLEKVPRHIPIFKIPDDNFGSVFVQQPFVDLVIENGLCGASFEDPSVEPFAKIIRGESLNVVPELPQ
jgi:hypothetical protein